MFGLKMGLSRKIDVLNRLSEIRKGAFKMRLLGKFGVMKGMLGPKGVVGSFMEKGILG